MLALLTIFGIIFLGVASPGPSFILVAQTAISKSRMHAILTATGMGLGSLFLASVAMLGLQIILRSIPWLYLLIKTLGALYLLYLAFRMWKNAKKSMKIEKQLDQPNSDLFKSFVKGLLVNISNPKTIAFYASVFSTSLPPQMTETTSIIILFSVLIISTGWYGFVALALSSRKLSTSYLSFKPYIDRIAGSILGVFGLKLLFENI